MVRAGKASIVLAVMLIACAPPASLGRSTPQLPLYGHPKRLSGIYETAFEVSLFNGCWLDFTKKAGTDFVKLYPKAASLRGERARFKLKLRGRETLRNALSPPARYGHLGITDCQIQATDVLSVEAVSDPK